VGEPLAVSSADFQGLVFARDLGYLSPQIHDNLDLQENEFKRMLNSFIEKLR
jgi:hypothetical protein